MTKSEQLYLSVNIMTPFEVYKQYVAVKLHFNNEKYDYIKCNGRTKNITQNSFAKRRDKYYFEKQCNAQSRRRQCMAAEALGANRCAVHRLRKRISNIVPLWSRGPECLCVFLRARL